MIKLIIAIFFALKIYLETFEVVSFYKMEQF